MTRLYIVEGLPCSGKSTTAKHVADFFKKLNKKVCFFDEESGNHPADYEYHAYISQEQYECEEDALKMKIKEYSTKSNGGYIVALSSFSEIEQQKLLKYKIYDFLP